MPCAVSVRNTVKEFLYRFFQPSQFKRSALPNGPENLRRRSPFTPRRLASTL
jgi:hypothetical protein